MRILLGQLRNNGDCLHATVLARQLRIDHPDAEIIWAVSRSCSALVANNPDVDAVWPIEAPDGCSPHQEWAWFTREAQRSQARGRFDRVVLSQVWPANYQNFDGTVRPSILNAYGRPVSVPVKNVMAPTLAEVERAEAFSHRWGLERRSRRILFECSSRSGQSFMTPGLAVEIAEAVLARSPDTIFVLSTDQVTQSSRPEIVSGAELSLMETAVLADRCTHMVGCGSGVSVSVLMTGRRLPTLQILAPQASVLGSVAHDLEFFDQDARHICETSESSPERLAEMILALCADGAEVLTDGEGDGRRPVRFDHYFDPIQVFLLNAGRALDAARSLRLTAARYGWREELVAFGRDCVEPLLDLDPGLDFPEGLEAADIFRSALAAGPREDCPATQRTYREAIRAFNAHSH